MTDVSEAAAELAERGAVVDHEARPERFDLEKANDTFLTLLGGAMCGGFTRPEIE